MDFLILDEASRNILRLWLSGRERLHNISYIRWAALKSASTAKLFHYELAEIVDCTGNKNHKHLALSLHKKDELINEERIQLLGKFAKAPRVSKKEGEQLPMG